MMQVLEGISQSVKILLNKKFKKFYEGFMVDLKTFLSLAIYV